MRIKKELIRVLLILLFPLFCLKSFGQVIQPKFDRDSSRTITLIEFKQRVDRAVKLLNTKPLDEISDTDHINIMMCANTIFMAEKQKGFSSVKVNGEEITFPNFEKRFSSGRYKKLEKKIKKIEYVTRLVKIYPEWRPNRGMGLYFPKLQMEIYGTPEPYAVFEVTE